MDLLTCKFISEKRVSLIFIHIIGVMLIMIFGFPEFYEKLENVGNYPFFESIGIFLTGLAVMLGPIFLGVFVVENCYRKHGKKMDMRID